jgi:hypothetical protein
VVLTSPGGLMVPGLIIGEAIRARRFATVAVDECASTCGLMWLAGVWRGVFENSAIGFHSIYEVDEGSTANIGMGQRRRWRVPDAARLVVRRNCLCDQGRAG